MRRAAILLCLCATHALAETTETTFKPEIGITIQPDHAHIPYKTRITKVTGQAKAAGIISGDYISAISCTFLAPLSYPLIDQIGYYIQKCKDANNSLFLIIVFRPSTNNIETARIAFLDRYQRRSNLRMPPAQNEWIEDQLYPQEKPIPTAEQPMPPKPVAAARPTEDPEQAAHAERVKTARQYFYFFIFATIALILYRLRSLLIHPFIYSIRDLIDWYKNREDIPQPRDPNNPPSLQETEQAKQHLQISQAFFDEAFETKGWHEQKNTLTQAARELAKARALDPDATLTTTQQGAPYTETQDQIAARLLYFEGKLYFSSYKTNCENEINNILVNNKPVANYHKKQAAADLKRALNTTIKCVTFHKLPIYLNQLAEIYHLMGKNLEAKTALEQALKLDPSNMDTLKLRSRLGYG